MPSMSIVVADVHSKADHHYYQTEQAWLGGVEKKLQEDPYSTTAKYQPVTVRPRSRRLSTTIGGDEHIPRKPVRIQARQKRRPSGHAERTENGIHGG